VDGGRWARLEGRAHGGRGEEEEAVDGMRRLARGRQASRP
jgi:hypothetical protein